MLAILRAILRRPHGDRGASQPVRRNHQFLKERQESGCGIQRPEQSRRTVVSVDQFDSDRDRTRGRETHVSLPVAAGAVLLDNRKNHEAPISGCERATSAHGHEELRHRSHLSVASSL